MPKTKTKRKDLKKITNPMALARARKPTGRINKDDLANAITSIKGASRPQLARIAKEVERMQKNLKTVNIFAGKSKSFRMKNR